jgi:hypothetical protein
MTTTRVLLTTTNARLVVLPGATIASLLSHAFAARGNRQNCNDAGFSEPDHAM